MLHVKKKELNSRNYTKVEFSDDEERKRKTWCTYRRNTNTEVQISSQQNLAIIISIRC